MLKALFVLEIFTFLSRLFGYGTKLIRKLFKIFDATDWITNNSNTHITQYLKK